MLSYESYKVLHVVSVIVFFSLIAWGAFGQSKVAKILSHVFLLSIFVGGMGLMARMGISHSDGWPQWIQLKMALWLVGGLLGIMLTGRLKKLAAPGLIFLLALAAVAVWSAVNKPAF